MKVYVLYEDQLASGGTPKNYGPHTLLLKCLFDRAEIQSRFPEFHLLEKQVQARPCKGNSNVLKHLQKDYDAFNDNRVVPVICLDLDRANRLLKLSKTSCKMQTKQAFWRSIGKPEIGAFVLLDQNLEDLLHIAQANGANFSKEQLRSAIDDKNLQDRDVLLLRASKIPSLRSALAVEDVPRQLRNGTYLSFRRLVEQTAALAVMD